MGSPREDQGLAKLTSIDLFCWPDALSCEPCEEPVPATAQPDPSRVDSLAEASTALQDRPMASISRQSSAPIVSTTRREVPGVGPVVGVRYGFGLCRHAPRRPHRASEPVRSRDAEAAAASALPAHQPTTRSRASDSAVERATTWPTAVYMQRLPQQRTANAAHSSEQMDMGGVELDGIQPQDLAQGLFHCPMAGLRDILLHGAVDYPSIEDLPSPPPLLSSIPEAIPISTLRMADRRSECIGSTSIDPADVSSRGQCLDAASTSDMIDHGDEREQAALPPAVGVRGKKKRGRKPIQMVFCKVPVCSRPISRDAVYFFRRKLCEECLNQPSLVIDGREVRFCQQCSQLHSVSDFDGSKRSCRGKLAVHKVRAVGSRQLRKAGNARK